MPPPGAEGAAGAVSAATEDIRDRAATTPELEERRQGALVFVKEEVTAPLSAWLGEAPLRAAILAVIVAPPSSRAKRERIVAIPITSFAPAKPGYNFCVHMLTGGALNFA